MKTPESRKIFAQKFLEKNSFQWGIYRPQKNIAVGSRNAKNELPVDRSGRPSNGQILPVASYRSTAPVDPNKQRALLSDPVDPDGRPSPCLPNVYRSVHVGRPTRSTDFMPSRLGQKTSRLVEAWNRNLGQKNSFKNILKNLLTLLKITKNSFIILH